MIKPDIKKRSGIYNPFRPGNGTEPPYLAGRDREIEWFRSSLDEALHLPQNMILSGLRGTGKTVLLKEFERICEEKKWLSVEREFDIRYCDEEEFIGAVLSDIITKTVGLSSLVARKKRKQIGFLASEEIGVLDRDYFANLLSQYHGPLPDRFKAILKEAYGIIQEAGFKGLVFLYDEFHSVENETRAKQFPLSLLLECFGHLQREGLCYYLVLSGLPPVFPNLVRAKTYAERMFTVWHIKELTKEAAQKAVVYPLQKVKVKFSQDLLARIISETKGYPYFLQFYSYFILRNIPKKLINVEDFEKIHPLLLSQLDDSFYAGRFNQATNGEKEILFSIADKEEVFTPSDVHKKIKISKGDLSSRLANLESKGLIYKASRGRYTFSLPLFSRYLERIQRSTEKY